ncbi:MAG: molecular chaperone DnaJ [Verrucomicrobiota bacterium]
MARSEIFRRHVAADPANPLFRFSLGQALWTEGDAAGAVEHLRLAAASTPDWIMPSILWGKSLLAVGDREGAKAAFADALALAVSQGHEEPEAELRALLATL